MKTNTLTRRRQQRQLTDAPLAQPVPAPVAQKSMQPSALTQPPAPVPGSSAVDAIRAAVTGGTPGSSGPGRPDSAPDVQRIGDAIRGGSTRRTVVRTAVWSVPVIAAATAAPAFALSPGVCSPCNGAAPTNCTIIVNVGDPIPPGQCRCADGLICAAIGPLNLANVCVATGLVATQCGATPCTGICLAAGGTVIAAVNTLVSTLTGPLATLDLLVGCNAGVTGFIPGDICTVPVTDVNAGNFGALCITNSGSGTIGGTATTAVAVLKAAVAALGVDGLLFANQCASPYSCQPGVRASAVGDGCLGQTLDLNVGFCQCV